MEDPNYVLLDNGLIRRFTRRGHEKELAQFWEELEKKGILKAGTAFQPIVSAFVLLEVVGVKVVGIPPALSTQQIKTFKRPVDYAVGVYENALEFYKSAPELKLTNVEEKLRETRANLSTEGQALYDAIIAQNLSRPDFETDLQISLSLDRMLQFPYPQPIVKELHMGGFWPMIAKSLEEGSGLSFLRLGIRMWEGLPAKKRRELFKVDNQRDLAKIFSTKSVGDLVDTELVHFATVGKMSNGYCFPVRVFTFDDPEMLKNRLAIYKTVLRLIKEKFEESHLDVKAFERLRGGVIYVFKTDGTLKETIVVDDIGND